MALSRFRAATVAFMTGTVALTLAEPPAMAAAARPSVSSLSTALGPATGGTAITVRGTRLDKVRSVAFGSTRVTRLTRVSSRTLRVTIPRHKPGTVQVRVRDSRGATGTSRPFTFLAAPRVTGLSRSAGPLAGGGVLTVSGSNFDRLTAVRVGSRPVTSWRRLSAQRITVTLPSLPPGFAAVRLTGVGGTSPESAASLYQALARPIVRDVSPGAGRVGAAGAGTTITVTGDNLLRVSRVVFGATPARSWRMTGSRTIAVVVPELAAGQHPLLVTSPGGTSAAGPDADYSAIPPPTVTAVNLTSGRLGGGDRITVTGTDFVDVRQVLVGGVAGTDLHREGENSVSVLTPAAPGYGERDVRVATGFGTSPSVTTRHFTYVAPPTGTATAVEAPSPGESASDSVAATGDPACTATACYVVGKMSRTVDDTTTSVPAVWTTRGDGTWSVTALPLPSTDRVTSAELRGVSCHATGCVAVGSYTVTIEDGRNTALRELVADMDIASGSWTVTAIPADADFESNLAELTKVACTDSGATCVATGSATRGFKRYWSVAERTAGVWSGRVFDAGEYVAALDIACYERTSCLVLTENPTDRAQNIAGWNGRQWTGGLVIPRPPGAKGGLLRSLDCTTGGYCVAVGNASFEDRSAPWILSDIRGSITSTVAPVPANVTNAALTSVSCSSGTGNCVAAGQASSETRAVGYVVAQRAGTWVADVPIRSAPRVSGFGLRGTGCSGDICVASGTISETSRSRTPYVVLHAAGGWRPVPVSVPEGLTYVSPAATACSSGGFCVAVGTASGAATTASVLTTITPTN